LRTRRHGEEEKERNQQAASKSETLADGWISKQAKEPRTHLRCRLV